MAQIADWQMTLARVVTIAGLVVWLGYAIAGLLGFIHTPVWLEYLPHFAGGITIIGLGFQAGKTLQRIEQTLQTHTAQLTKIEYEITQLKKTVSHHDKRLDRLEQ
ncbi:hypothetical protein CMO91_01775 [Candidatus Woesearchaeota archaeon]|nr:hypothetical protein [Candidatus Woesearchaeota archaeon]|tara:strand:- start:1816 stop:2130 length:315 start_codon:yes stop_codon:yes gene_type:complete